MQVKSLGQKDPLAEGSHPVFLPGETYGQRSTAGYNPRGCRVRHDLAMTQSQLMKKFSKNEVG